MDIKQVVFKCRSCSEVSVSVFSRAPPSDGPVSACGPAGVGQRPATGDRAPSSAPVPQKLPPVPVTDTSRASWEYKEHTRKPKDGWMKELIQGFKEGMIDARMSTVGVPCLAPISKRTG